MVNPRLLGENITSQSENSCPQTGPNTGPCSSKSLWVGHQCPMLEPLPAWRCVCVGEGASDYSAGSTERESVHGPEDPFLAPHTFLF